MKQVRLNVKLFTMFVIAFLVSCSKPEVDSSKTIGGSEYLIQNTKFSTDLETEYKTYQKFEEAAKREVGSQNAI